MIKILLRYNNILIYLVTFIGISCANLTEQVLYKDPLTATEHNNLGVAYEKQGKLDLAINEYKKSAKKDKELLTPLVHR